MKVAGEWITAARYTLDRGFVMFKTIEQAPVGHRVPLASVLEQLRYTPDQLIPAIAQQYDTGDVLMLAWMNAESLRETLTTGRVCYYSRSRQRLWRKGEQSGQVQTLKSLCIDCDGDALLLKVDQRGPACHTGRASCFFFEVDGAEVVINAEPLIAPEDLYGKPPTPTPGTA